MGEILQLQPLLPAPACTESVHWSKSPIDPVVLGDRSA